VGHWGGVGREGGGPPPKGKSQTTTSRTKAACKNCQETDPSAFSTDVTRSWQRQSQSGRFLEMPSRRLIKDPERYKTVLCATWTANGDCPYGRKCQFAHGKEELRTRAALQANEEHHSRVTPVGRVVLVGGTAPQGATVSGGQLPHAPLVMWPANQQPKHQMPPMPQAPGPAAAAVISGAPTPVVRGMPPLPPGPPPPAPVTSISMVPGCFGTYEGGSRLPGALLPAALGAGAGAAAPSVEPPLPPALLAAPPAASAATAPAMGGRKWSLGDELAQFAMKCHVADGAQPCEKIEEDGELPPPRIWSQAVPLPPPLRCNPVSGKVEAMSPGLEAPLDSPLEPSVGQKGREVSFSTLLVRRAVSFIFDDPMSMEPRLGSALSSPRHATPSPAAAIAA
jgi:hypothetical protein